MEPAETNWRKEQRNRERQSVITRKPDVRKFDKNAGFKAGRRLLMDLFKSRPCADCRQSFDPVCMDWDHLSSEKSFTISRVLYTKNLPDLIDELCKCELVCSNCHRLRTKRRTTEL